VIVAAQLPPELFANNAVLQRRCVTDTIGGIKRNGAVIDARRGTGGDAAASKENHYSPDMVLFVDRRRCTGIRNASAYTKLEAVPADCAAVDGQRAIIQDAATSRKQLDSPILPIA